VKGTLSLETNLETVHSAEEQWVSLDGVRVRYLRSGSGPPLVLLHGLLGYSFSWRFALPVFSQWFTVYALDMPGAGLSDRPARPDTGLRANAETVLRFLDRTGVRSCDLLGSSHGGAVAMMAAGLAPERVRRLVLVAPVNPWSLRGRGRALFLSNRIVAPLFLRLAPYLGISHSFFMRRLFGDERRIHPGTLEGYSAPFSISGTFEHKLAMLRPWQQDLQELESVLPRIADVPTLLLWGSKDRAVSVTSAAQLCQRLRNCRLRLFEGVGHVPFEEVPEEFNRAVMEFLRCGEESPGSSQCP
jgi:pimeloyl-ACP methyl ester carboxylesterase